MTALHYAFHRLLGHRHALAIEAAAFVLTFLLPAQLLLADSTARMRQYIVPLECTIIGEEPDGKPLLNGDPEICQNYITPRSSPSPSPQPSVSPNPSQSPAPVVQRRSAGRPPAQLGASPVAVVDVDQLRQAVLPWRDWFTQAGFSKGLQGFPGYWLDIVAAIGLFMLFERYDPLMRWRLFWAGRLERRIVSIARHPRRRHRTPR